jgi:hypothetical protein
MALRRAQLLLDKEQHAKLGEMARESGRSMSEVVRQIMDEHIARLSEDKATQTALIALDELAQIRQTIEKRHGTLPGSLLESLREERDSELTSDDEIAR